MRGGRKTMNESRRREEEKERMRGREGTNERERRIE